MGVVIIVTLAFGLITPPYGLALLMASKFVGVRFGRAMLASFPIYVVFFARDRVLHLLPRGRAVAAQAPAAGIGRLLQKSERRRIHLPLRFSGVCVRHLAFFPFSAAAVLSVSLSLLPVYAAAVGSAVWRRSAGAKTRFEPWKRVRSRAAAALGLGRDAAYQVAEIDRTSG